MSLSVIGARTNLAAFDLTTGTAATWASQVSVDYVAALAVWNNRLYMAGSFTVVGLQTVPLVGGYGVCTDIEATALPRRFYRANVP